jgi:hypothetical protein
MRELSSFLILALQGWIYSGLVLSALTARLAFSRSGTAPRLELELSVLRHGGLGPG